MAKAVASTLVQSRLDYSNSLLHGTSASNLKKLQRVQNSLSRVVLNRRICQSSVSLRVDLHWLSVKQRIDFKLDSVVYKALSTGQPPYLSSLLQPYQPTRSLRSSDKHLLAIPKHGTSFGRRSFSIGAPAVWNSIPLEIRSATSLQLFKLKLKNYYLSIL